MTRGFTTLEILIALLVLSTTIVSVSLVAFGLPAVMAAASDHRTATGDAANRIQPT